MAIKNNKEAFEYIDINKFPNVYTYYKLLYS